ncbi:hypothetical protein B4109_1710 [Geobacillus stearothermophilus]|uniref:Uncharacterized protein n=1 Tax=Geobacillus stearothermophilus TaxID=1422 RepID=A0A150MXD1_GEOSE|nr:hypothetical protein B4109_1710 [Geobacillus stearothermophilus]
MAKFVPDDDANGCSHSWIPLVFFGLRSSYLAQETPTSTTKGSKWERNARSPFLLCMI